MASFDMSEGLAATFSCSGQLSPGMGHEPRNVAQSPPFSIHFFIPGLPHSLTHLPGLDQHLSFQCLLYG